MPVFSLVMFPNNILGLLTIWPLISSLVALRLLTEEFASIQTAREFAIKCLLQCNDKLLFSILPQLIAALEYEIPQDGAICDFIVRKSLRNDFRQSQIIYLYH